MEHKNNNSYDIYDIGLTFLIGLCLGIMLGQYIFLK